MTATGMRDPFGMTTADRWVERLHRWELKCRGHRWSLPVGVVAWAGFMTALIISNPALKRADIGRSLARFWTWQIWRRTARRPILVHLPDQCFLFLPPSNKHASLTVAVGMHEPREELFTSRFLLPGDVVVDVGANVGLYTTMAAARGARVYAFEPSTNARRVLTQNVRINRCVQVEIIPAALSDCYGTLQLTVGLDVANHLVDSAPGQRSTSQPSETVDVFTLDDLTTGPSPRIFGPIALIKIDAEGFDDKVLRGAEATIARDHPVLIIETWGGDPTIRMWLEARGFSVYLHAFETFELMEYPKPWLRNANFIAVHSDSLSMVSDRLATAKDTRGSRLGLPELLWSRKAQRIVREAA